MKYKRLAKKLGVKEAKPGALISKMHSLKGMPKRKHHKVMAPGGYSTANAIPKAMPSQTRVALPAAPTGSFNTDNAVKFKKKKHNKMRKPKPQGKGIVKALGQKGFSNTDGLKEPSFKKHKMACKAHHKINCKNC